MLQIIYSFLPSPFLLAPFLAPQTTFVNSVDAASLALVIPIIHRALRDRSSETKKKAAQITGNMVSLVTDHKELRPYLPLLLPELQKVLLDPHPDVRAVAAKALGSLVKGLGEQRFADLVPWLLQTLKSDASSVERSGAAQGLGEVRRGRGWCGPHTVGCIAGRCTCLLYLSVSV